MKKKKEKKTNSSIAFSSKLLLLPSKPCVSGGGNVEVAVDSQGSLGNAYVEN